MVSLQETVDHFERIMDHNRNLLEIHTLVGGADRGRRFRETSISPLICVLSVSAWQVCVEGICAALIPSVLAAAPPASNPQGYANTVKSRLRKFSTANYDNSMEMFRLVGFDPTNAYRWTQQGGRGKAAQKITESEVKAAVDDWNRVRNAIAHGDPEPPPVKVLSSVRQEIEPKIWKRDAQAGIAFIRSTTQITMGEAALVLQTPAPSFAHPITRPSLGYNL